MESTPIAAATTDSGAGAAAALPDTAEATGTAVVVTWDTLEHLDRSELGDDFAAIFLDLAFHLVPEPARATYGDRVFKIFMRYMTPTEKATFGGIIRYLNSVGQRATLAAALFCALPPLNEGEGNAEKGLSQIVPFIVGLNSHCNHGAGHHSDPRRQLLQLERGDDALDFTSNYLYLARQIDPNPMAARPNTFLFDVYRSSLLAKEVEALMVVADCCTRMNRGIALKTAVAVVLGERFTAAAEEGYCSWCNHGGHVSLTCLDAPAEYTMPNRQDIRSRCEGCRKKGHHKSHCVWRYMWKYHEEADQYDQTKPLGTDDSARNQSPQSGDPSTGSAIPDNTTITSFDSEKVADNSENSKSPNKSQEDMNHIVREIGRLQLGKSHTNKPL
jgi:hypothetical protein